MKYLSFILALYVLLLTAVPNVVEDKCFQEQTTEQSQDNQNDKDCSECCSPFMSCNTCLGFTFPIANFSIHSILTYSDKKVSIYKENTTSNLEASRWLHVSYPTWKKYASLYIDTETQLNLFELHKITGNQKRLLLPTTRYKRKAVSAHTFQPVPLTEILENKHPKFNLRIFKKRLNHNTMREGRN